MIRSNYHTHSIFCDGANTLEEMAQAAVDAGLTDLGFSSHFPLPYENDWAMPEEKLSNYIQGAGAVKKEYAGRLAIALGAEVDYFMELGNYSTLARENLSRFDYIIGAVHTMGLREDESHGDIDGPYEDFVAAYNEIYGGDPKKLVQTYYRAIGEMAQGCRPEIVAHLDIIKKNNLDYRFFSEEEDWYHAAVEDALDAILASGSIVEINTGGMPRYGERCLYPRSWIMERLYEKKIPITVSSDSHKTATINYYFTEIENQLMEKGFTEIMAFDQGSWVPRPLGGE